MGGAADTFVGWRRPGFARNVRGVSQSRKIDAERRQAKLQEIEELVRSGSLTVRPMTAEERKLYPPRPVAPRKRRSY